MANLEGAPVAGSRAGRYLFLRQLTTSHVGSLWEARCEAEQPLLALARVAKVPSDIDGDTQQALAESAWDSMELDDDSLVRVADVVFGTGWFALFHDHFEGDTVRTMQRRVQERKSGVPVPVALRVVLDALEAAQRIGEAIDQLGAPWRSATIDPGSLLVCDDGRTRLLDGFVGDFVARVPKMSRESETLSYIAPEQLEGTAEPDARANVFRWALIAWELLSSKRLLVGSRQAIARRLKSPILRVDRVARVGAGASPAVAEVLGKALSLDPGDRYATLAEFANALAGAADQVARPEDVIQFTDALAGRESTLARLLMDKPPRLSDAMKSVRPTADVAKSFAHHVRASALKVPALGTPAAGALAPDAMFRPLPRVEQPARLSPPAISKRTTTPAPYHMVAAGTEPAHMPEARQAVRPHFKTLIGLSDELPQRLPPLPSLAEASHEAHATATAHASTASDAPQQSSRVSIAQTRADTVPEDSEGLDDLDDAPTQAYSIRQFTDLAAETAPRTRLESGPRLASKPPSASAADSAPGSNLEEPVDLETTLPAADNAALVAGVVRSAIATGQGPAAQASRENSPASAPAAVLPATKALADRRLLAIAMFFAGTTLTLALVVVGLVARSESAEETAALLANAPPVQMPAAPAVVPVIQTASTAAEPEPVQAPAEVREETNDETDEKAQGSAADEEEAPPSEDERARGEEPSPPSKPFKARPVRRAKRAVAPAPKRYVPNDI